MGIKVLLCLPYPADLRIDPRLAKPNTELHTAEEDALDPVAEIIPLPETPAIIEHPFGEDYIPSLESFGISALSMGILDSSNSALMNFFLLFSRI